MSTYADILTALADPTRRFVFESLRNGRRSVGDIAAGLPVSRPAVSQHIRVLKEAGLIRDIPSGTKRYYEVVPAGLEPLKEYLERSWDQVLAAFAAAANERQGGDDA